MVPFTVVANRFKSSSLDSEKFIHDPLQALQDAQVNEGILEGLDLTGWTVSTFVVNHHQTLNAKHLYALVSADDDEKTVGVQLQKLQARGVVAAGHGMARGAPSA